MRKIMFNDRYGLTQAVIEGRKSVTRRIEGGAGFQEMADNADEIFYNENDGTLDMRYEGIDIFSHKPRYKVGEVVAVAQSYRTILYNLESPDNYCCMEHWEQDNQNRAKYAGEIYTPGYGNKMYVCANMMPHRIRITGINCERLYDISDADCLKEGIRYSVPIGKFYLDDFCRKEVLFFDSPRDAFAFLIDKIYGLGTWGRNPWVTVYEFELIK